MIFIAVNTPTKSEGDGAGMAADLKYVEACSRNISKIANSDKIIIEKSLYQLERLKKLKKS